jgi:hypothetical protein
MKMKKLLLVCAISSFMGSAAMAQNADALPVKDQSAVELEDFPGCQVAPPKNGCTARISCVGEANILFVDSAGVREATKAASLNARKKLAQFFGDKVKAKEAMVEATKTVAKSGPEGDTASREMARATAEVTESSAEALLQGVVTLGRTISKEDKIVQIKIGQSCQSKAAAASGATVIPSGNAGSGGAAAGAPATGGPKVFGDGAVRSQRQRARSDDF